MERKKLKIYSEDGAIMPMVVVLFLMMVVMAGMGVDFMRHEHARADLQNALDRGVLAATAMSQTLGQAEDGMSEEEVLAAKTEVVRSYMRARTFALEDPQLEVEIPDDLETYESALDATARYDLDTFFLKIAGFNRMGVPASSYAEQATLDIEIAIVLDVSASMLWDSAVPADEDDPSAGFLTKLDAMKLAAMDFVEGVMEDQEDSRTLISVIPYGGHVSANPYIARHYGMTAVPNFDRVHGYSYCFDFLADENGNLLDHATNPNFLEIPIRQNSGTFTPRQVQHIQSINTSTANQYFPDAAGVGQDRHTCPLAANQLFAYSTNVEDIQNAIDGLVAEWRTSTYLGVKWGAALLDPSSQDLVTAMIDERLPTDVRASEALSDEYDNWPQEYSRDSAEKYLIIFSDGRNTRHTRVNNNDDYYTPTPGLTDEELATEQAEREEYWGTTRLGDGEASQNALSNAEAHTMNETICQTAKDQAGDDGNLTIFSVAYDLDGSSAANAAALVLQNCASNPASDFFNILGGEDPASAFEAIRSRLSLLKLAQNDR